MTANHRAIACAVVARAYNRGKVERNEEDAMPAMVKAQAHALIDSLPDSATWQQVLYTLEVRADIEAGLGDAEAGRVTAVADVRREYGLE